MRLFFGCILCAGLAFILGAFVMTFANPEVDFWANIRDKRDHQIAELRKERPKQPVIIFTGGSSCAFSIRPEIIEEVTGMPAMNYGAAAGTGSKFLIEQALQRCQKGDVLILAMETHFLTEEGRGKPTSLGMSLALSDRDIQLAVGGDTFGDSVSVGEFFGFMRPGARYSATWLGKSIKGDLSYRYKEGDYRNRGWLVTEYRDPPLEPVKASRELHLTEEGKHLLMATLEKARARGVRVFYSLPWIFSDQGIVVESRKLNQELLREISEIMPVLGDPKLGIQPDSSLFADTVYHLNVEGAEARSRIVAQGLSVSLGQ